MAKTSKPRRIVRTRVVKINGDVRRNLMVHACCISRIEHNDLRLLTKHVRMGDVAQMTKTKLHRMFGRQDIRAYKRYLANYGLTFGVKLARWTPYNPLPRHP